MPLPLIFGIVLALAAGILAAAAGLAFSLAAGPVSPPDPVALSPCFGCRAVLATAKASDGNYSRCCCLSATDASHDYLQRIRLADPRHG